MPAVTVTEAIPAVPATVVGAVLTPAATVTAGTVTTAVTTAGLAVAPVLTTEAGTAATQLTDAGVIVVPLSPVRIRSQSVAPAELLPLLYDDPTVALEVAPVQGSTQVATGLGPILVMSTVMADDAFGR